MKYFKKLTGEKCYLSPINIEDYDLYTKWINDLEIGKYLFFAGQSINKQKEKEVLQDLAEKHNYAIIDKKNDKLIGNCGFVSIDDRHSKSEVGIFIGDKDYLSKGYGSEALSLLIQYGFDYLNLHNIFLMVYDFNKRAIKSYKKIGFKEVGIRREAMKRNGKYHDIIYMDILPGELNKRYLN